MSNHGSFSGNPKTEWLVDKSGADRNMRLLEDFLFTDPDGRKWPAPSGSIIDGASIPRPLWTTVGSPYTDDYRRASVVHDVACDSPTIPRKDADVMFYHACIAGGCSFLQAKLLFRVPFKAVADERFVQDKFQELAIDVKLLRDDATIAELDAVIDKHLQF
jgi:Protein of unknown function (DUF1353)